MKKIFICILSLTLAFSFFAACGDDSSSSKGYRPKDSSVQGNYEHGGSDNGEWSPAA